MRALGSLSLSREAFSYTGQLQFDITSPLITIDFKGEHAQRLQCEGPHIPHNACTNDLNTFCRQRISQGPQNHSRSRANTLEIHTHTLSLRRSKVTTHTTPRPDTILEGQSNNGAFRQRSVTVNKGDVEAPEGPGDTELSHMFHSTQEA